MSSRSPHAPPGSVPGPPARLVRRSPRRIRAALACALLAASTLGARPAGAPLPAIVFVSRVPIAGDPLAVPGLGPHQRSAAPGGRLLVRERDGRVRELAPGVFHDASDPAVSFDARRIAFAATVHPDSAWRIWIVGVDGRGLAAVTGAAPGPRADDFDPCWIGADRLCFASTRGAARAEYADVPASNLFLVRVPGPGEPAPAPRRITAERNGAEEPAFDARRETIVYARWWFNRFRAAPGGGLAVRLPHEPDSVNLWQAVEIDSRGRGVRLAGGDIRSRRGTMNYQPALAPDGALLGVYAANLGLSPRPGPLGIHRFRRRLGPERAVAGAIVAATGGDAYGGARGLAAPSACAPAALPDGRVLFSYAPGARGDLGLFVTAARGGSVARVLDLEGTLELDAAPIVRRPLPATAWPIPTTDAHPLLPADEASLLHPAATFRFHDLDVFARRPDTGPRPAAPPVSAGARIRFFAALARPGGGDTAVLIREARVGDDGSVDEAGLPALVPMFEQLVDSAGRVLMSAHGAAEVTGWNAGAPGGTTRCVGCHLGHSALEAGATPRTPSRRRGG